MNEFHKTPRTEARTLSNDLNDILRNPKTRKSALALGVVASVAVGFAGCATASAEAQRGSVYDGSIHPDITSINLENGANIRSEPRVKDDDFTIRLDTLELGDGKFITVPTPEGAYVDTDNNGAWYGIPVSELTDVANVHVDGDGDGIVWVNQQKATLDENSQ